MMITIEKARIKYVYWDNKYLELIQSLVTTFNVIPSEIKWKLFV